MIIVRGWWVVVRFGFRLLYNELAWTYDTVSWLVSLGAWRKWQRAALRFVGSPQGGCVLELAHGTGNFQIDLRTARLTSVGCDLSAHMGRLAQRKLLRHRIRPLLARNRAQELPFASGAFPAVVATFPTEFILDPDTLAEVHRVLAPGGRLVIVASGQLLGGGIVRGILEWAFRVTGQRGPWPEWMAERFVEAGFDLQLETVSFERSEVRVIVANRVEN